MSGIAETAETGNCVTSSVRFISHCPLLKLWPSSLSALWNNEFRFGGSGRFCWECPRGKGGDLRKHDKIARLIRYKYTMKPYTNVHSLCKRWSGYRINGPRICDLFVHLAILNNKRWPDLWTNRLRVQFLEDKNVSDILGFHCKAVMQNCTQKGNFHLDGRDFCHLPSKDVGIARATFVKFLKTVPRPCRQIIGARLRTFWQTWIHIHRPGVLLGEKNLIEVISTKRLQGGGLAFVDIEIKDALYNKFVLRRNF